MIKVILLIIITLLLSSCGSSLMMQTQRMTQIEDDYALVTFIRPSSFGGGVTFGIWDRENLIGVLTAKSYIQYLAKPGENVFLGRAENWSFVKANLEAGKHYYVLGKVFPGVWKARIAFDPINKDDEVTDEQIKEWMNGLDPIKVIPEKREGYVKPRLEQVRQALKEYESGAAKYMTLEADDNR